VVVPVVVVSGGVVGSVVVEMVEPSVVEEVG